MWYFRSYTACALAFVPIPLFYRQPFGLSRLPPRSKLRGIRRGEFGELREADPRLVSFYKSGLLKEGRSAADSPSQSIFVLSSPYWAAVEVPRIMAIWMARIDFDHAF